MCHDKQGMNCSWPSTASLLCKSTTRLPHGNAGISPREALKRNLFENSQGAKYKQKSPDPRILSLPTLLAVDCKNSRFSTRFSIIPDWDEAGLIYVFALCPWPRNSTGSITKVQTRVKARPTVRSTPMLAVPWCGENMRLAKSTSAVSAL